MVALERWPRDGVPDNPGAWIVAHRAQPRDRPAAPRAPLRGEAAASWSGSMPAAAGRPDATMSSIPDDRLRLFFTCCHPALAPEARVALTLRTLGGLSTPEIARAFLTGEPAMQQRLVRAKRKIRDGRHPLRGAAGRASCPTGCARCSPSLYLIFNEGYLATSADTLVRRELCDEAIRLGRVLGELMPDEREARGLLALMLLHHSRRDARVDERGELVLLDDQDRSLWHARGDRRRDSAGGAGRRDGALRDPGRDRRRARASATDWRDRLAPHRELLRRARGGRAVRRGRAQPRRGRGDGGRARRPGCESDRAGSSAASSTTTTCCTPRAADLLRRLGRDDEAAAAYRRALELAANPVERALPGAAASRAGAHACAARALSGSRPDPSRGSRSVTRGWRWWRSARRTRRRARGPHPHARTRARRRRRELRVARRSR